jgi:hypothetical protein
MEIGIKFYISIQEIGLNINCKLYRSLWYNSTIEFNFLTH